MKTEDRIRAIAEDFVAQSQSKAARLKAELTEARQRVAQLTAESRWHEAGPEAPRRL